MSIKLKIIPYCWRRKKSMLPVSSYYVQVWCQNKLFLFADSMLWFSCLQCCDLHTDLYHKLLKGDLKLNLIVFLHLLSSRNVFFSSKLLLYAICMKCRLRIHWLGPHDYRYWEALSASDANFHNVSRRNHDFELQVCRKFPSWKMKSLTVLC